MTKSIPALCAVALLAACNEGRRDELLDRAAIDSLRAEHVRAVNSRNADLLLSGMTEEVVYLAPDLAPVLGRQALDALIRPLYQQFAPAITMTPKEVVVNGDVAFEWGCLGGHIDRVGGGEPILNSGKYVFIYRWAPATGWKTTHDAYNNGPCLAP